jgi:hypothetical protein
MVARRVRRLSRLARRGGLGGPSKVAALVAPGDVYTLAGGELDEISPRLGRHKDDLAGSGVDQARIVRELSNRHTKRRPSNAALRLDDGIRAAVVEVTEQRGRLVIGAELQTGWGK